MNDSILSNASVISLFNDLRVFHSHSNTNSICNCKLIYCQWLCAIFYTIWRVYAHNGEIPWSIVLGALIHTAMLEIMTSLSHPKPLHTQALLWSIVYAVLTISWLKFKQIADEIERMRATTFYLPRLSLAGASGGTQNITNVKQVNNALGMIKIKV